MTEVAVPQELFALILGKIDRFRLVPDTGIAMRRKVNTRIELHAGRSIRPDQEESVLSMRKTSLRASLKGTKVLHRAQEGTKLLSGHFVRPRIGAATHLSESMGWPNEKSPL